MPLRDLQLFFVRVGAKLNDLHAVKKRPRNRVRRVCGRDEHALAEVKRNLDIVVAEARILRGIENLQKRGRGVALIVAAELIDLVEQQKRVLTLRLRKTGHDSTGHGSDVGLAVAADLRFIVHAAERNARKLSVERSCDRDGNRRFANAGRADQAENLPRKLGRQLPHGERLQNPLFDLLKAKVIVIENFCRCLHVQPLFCPLVPRKLQHEVQIVPDDGGLGGVLLLLGKPPRLL